MPIEEYMIRRRRLAVLFLCLWHASLEAKVYVVGEGDTIIGIARKTSTPAPLIRRLNELTTDTLAIGQKLILPDEIQTYTVQPGDTLLGIARHFGTSLSSLILANQLPHETIYPGQKLVIPILSSSHPPASSSPSPSPSPSSSPLWHRVENGETLYSIARRYGVTVENLLAWNNKTSPTLFVGEKLRILTNTPPDKPPPRPQPDRPPAQKDRPPPLTDGTFPIDTSLIARIESTPRGVRVWVRDNTSLRSTTTGVVEYTGWLYGFGNVIILSLGAENRLVFGELDRISVRKGQKVREGDVLAVLSAGENFYLEVRQGTTVIDPLKWYHLTIARKSTPEENL